MVTAMSAETLGSGLPWKLARYQKRPSTSSDHWSVLPEWVVKVHGHPRVQPFQPLHSSFPLDQSTNEGALQGDRVTVAFFAGHDDPREFHDSWLTSPTRESRALWKSYGQWTGFTFFRRKTSGGSADGNEAGSQAAKEMPSDNGVGDVTSSMATMTLTIKTGYGQGGAIARGKAALAAPSSRQVEQAETDDDDSFACVEGP